MTPSVELAWKLAQRWIGEGGDNCRLPNGERTYFWMVIEHGLRMTATRGREVDNKDDILTYGEKEAIEEVLYACLLALGKDWKPTSRKTEEQIMKEIGF